MQNIDRNLKKISKRTAILKLIREYLLPTYFALVIFDYFFYLQEHLKRQYNNNNGVTKYLFL